MGLQGVSRNKPPMIKPLLMALIDTHKFECVQMLLDAGARIDVYEWIGEESGEEENEESEETKNEEISFQYSVAGRSPLHAFVLAVYEEAEEREKEGRGGEGEDLGDRVDEKKRDALKLSLLPNRRIAPLSKERGCARWKVRTEACRFLIEVLDTYSVYREELKSTDKTALDLACLCGEADIARGLMEVEEADRVRPEEQHLTLLAVVGGMLRSDETCLSVLQLLADKRADFTRAGLGDFSHSPLSLACEWALEKSAEFLLSKGVAVGGVAGKNGESRFLWLRHRRLIPISLPFCFGGVQTLTRLASL
uniref:Uncharacterized protein n=1 Tax=Chromera velia CCMP2878 TaxID=1169474 RepID=A0A0G4F1B7_9ALVE|eukprot:Cvel_14581.t1-p1 / transcript=Cvel_14581.t1 / gene=Cvel_14581 / organism=Chromera_velia_CCMP2878 / gene_product=hypothetical protein / transcript_product=hypothetical protein / location=Cvel_scaffold1042:40247-41167(-) / protein_length=307 / sequence_SO=supercontig / SO=protein_coding / is_pseudo=false